MIYVGIDPGKHGGISAIDEGAEILVCKPMPVITGGGHTKVEYDLGRIFSTLVKQGEIWVTIEKLAPMPPKLGGAAANYQRGYAMGMFQAFCTALRVRWDLVPPSRWQKAFWKGKTDTKQASIMMAERLFPDAELLPTERSRRKHDGMSDSLLIAEYGRRHANGLLT